MIELDVWLDVSADEEAKLKRFNMMKREFLAVGETKTGAGALAFAAIAGLAGWAAWHLADTWVPSAALLASSCVGMWLGTKQMGAEGTLSLKVKDFVNKPVPFTRDNPSDIHEIANKAEEQYDHLFGAMFEIESLGNIREFTWKKEAHAS